MCPLIIVMEMNMHLAAVRLLTLAVSLGFLACSAFAVAHDNDRSDSQWVVSDSGLFAFDPETLAMRWHQLQDQQTFEPVVIDDRLLVTGSRGLYAVASESGDILWKRSSKQVGFPVVSAGEIAYLASRDGSLEAIDSRTGSTLWQQQFPGWVYPPARSGELLFTGGSEGRLWAIDRNNGDLRWSSSVGQEMVYSPVALADGQIIVTTFNREVISFDRLGNRLWRQTYPAIMTTPMVLNGQLIFNGLDRRLRAIDADSGKILWQRQLPEPLVTGLRHQRGLLLAALESGRVWVLISDSGELQQEYRLPGEPITRPLLVDGEVLGFIRAFGGPKAVVATRFEQSEKK
ncbi:MAG: PQQ-binding-like beta-propeller repeat protein [Candidatus Thiodiazotropha sp. (ex Lucinoma borealis)]|nr:PQQ-binding-like beta-propeller repeat protein [Candidatus Thiodiazotropha sp. (ex Lucinoma borealis)]